MRGSTSLLWPVRYKPLPDELLSSWLVRLANGNGLKVQTFCNLIFGNSRQVWNRDVDRLAPSWLVAELSARTGTPLDTAQATTLRVYEEVLYARFKTSGALPWMQTLQMYHRKREGFGMQYCGSCLAEDSQPYFRKAWRVSFNTICSQHGCMLHDRCPQCGSGVAFHRMDVGYDSVPDADAFASCHLCKCDLRNAATLPIISYDAEASESHKRLCQGIRNSGRAPESMGLILDEMRVRHHLCSLLTSRYKTVTLRQYICDQLGVEDICPVPERVAFETRSLVERHHLMQLVVWLELDLESRLRQAWRDKAVRYNHLLKGFKHPPKSYVKVAEIFSDWRLG
ncbi:hypothetical protein DT070_05230 [Polaromonas sp. SP1]|nr:hypothetical protein DT070_05230 [Polaromonas sp. SP1]